MIAAVIALIIMLLTGAAVLSLSRSSLRILSANKERTIALGAAEAGADYTIAQLELRQSEWATLVESHPELFQNHPVGKGYFTVEPLQWIGARKVRITSKGYAHQGGRVVSIVRSVRIGPFVWRYALFAEGNIAATGSASVQGSIHSNANINPAGAGVTVGGAFVYTALRPYDLVESYGNIYDTHERIPDNYELPQSDYVPLPSISWTAFQNPANFPGVTVYNVRQADATHPRGTMVQEADGSYSFYWQPTAGTGGGKKAYNITVGVSDFNSWFVGRDGNTKVVVNWLAGIPAGGNSYDYTLHLTGTGTITATLVVPDIAPSNSSVVLSGGVVFAPLLGVAILTDTVDMSNVVGTVDLGTVEHPALVLVTGGATFSAAGTIQTQGSLIVGGTPGVTPDIDVKGNASFTFNEGFISRLPEEWQDYFTGGPSSTRPLAWQQLGGGA